MKRSDAKGSTSRRDEVLTCEEGLPSASEVLLRLGTRIGVSCLSVYLTLGDGLLGTACFGGAARVDYLPSVSSRRGQVKGGRHAAIQLVSRPSSRRGRGATRTSVWPASRALATRPLRARVRRRLIGLSRPSAKVSTARGKVSGAAVTAPSA